MTIQPIITTATSQAQREEAERSGLPWFVASFEVFLIAARAFHGQDDIDPAALISGIAEIRVRAAAGFTAETFLELQGRRSPGRLPIWEELLLAALATRIGLGDDVDTGEIETARRLGLV
ncbi:hypothetical protein [Methylobacterium sp. SyP6R]|uniref:hypothetical protein n=1 Tax=Methylobacterium sp. SyP6R TaxID=2718876 RepID=UPI001F41C30E|nr:hypothetical protein [Methylobacterium sp. SyP6R]MCF4130055.1 hypothetical protein [Methylobacterium sp. SyP6R]